MMTQLPEQLMFFCLLRLCLYVHLSHSYTPFWGEKFLIVFSVVISAYIMQLRGQYKGRFKAQDGLGRKLGKVK